MGSRVRLQAIFDLVKAPCVLADIGCDHGLLPIRLVEQGKCALAYACDVNPGPLSRAKQAIEAAGLQEQVFPILCDGLEGLTDDVTAVVIAGMGYDTIVHILSEGEAKTAQLKQIIVQCNGHVEAFRYWLSEHGYTIDAECIVKDGHYYQLISMHKQETPRLSERQCLFGVYLADDPLFFEYWQLQLSKKRKILSQISIVHEHYKKTEHLIQMIEKELE